MLAPSRLSEDVDLTYDIRKLADEQAGHPDALSDAEAKSLGRRIRVKLLPRLLETEIQPYPEAQIGAAGLQATVERDEEKPLRRLRGRGGVSRLRQAAGKTGVRRPVDGRAGDAPACRQ